MKIIDFDLNFEADHETFFHSYGGESYIDELELKEYGLQIGNIAIGNITPEQMKNFGLTIINHLAINGHSFELWHEPGVGEQLRPKS